MIRKHKKYSRPRKAYDITRISEENTLVERYGLKNKKEIWKAEERIKEIRNRAKNLITAGNEKQEILISKLNKMGLNVSKIADILALNKEDYLKRRLQSIVAEKKIAKTPKAARQFIVHKHIAIDKKIVNIPSYIVPVEQEDKIEIVRMKTKEMAQLEKASGEKNE